MYIWGASVLASRQPRHALFLEAVALAPDRAGQHGPDALFEAGAVVAAHPAGEGDRAVIDEGLIADHPFDWLECSDIGSLGQGDDIALGLAVPERYADAAADENTCFQRWRHRIVKLAVQGDIDNNFCNHGDGL